MFYRWFYTLLFYCLLPAILLRLLFRSIKAPAYRRRWAERFGIFPILDDTRPTLWLHAVSVGELLAALPLVKVLLRDYPDHRLVITTTTPTGSERAQVAFAAEIAEQRIVHVYAPYDIPLMLNTFLKRFSPRLVMVMETELWPNMIHACFSRQIPVLIANARLSEKSAKGYAWLSGLTKAMLSEVSLIAAQNRQDGERFVELGLNPKKLQVTGSIKFDLDLSAAIQQQARELKSNWSGSNNKNNKNNKRLILLAASTHPGEDEIILSVFKDLKIKRPDILLVLVPRHPERFNSAYQLCAKKNFKTERRSVTRNNVSHVVAQDVDIVLGDSMGELLAFYGACDIAFVGGSLVPVGGHNLIEPAAWAKPILCGQHLFNFSEVKNLLLKDSALIICDGEKELKKALEELLSNESKRLAIGSAAQKIALENRGALHKLTAAIAALIK